MRISQVNWKMDGIMANLSVSCHRKRLFLIAVTEKEDNLGVSDNEFMIKNVKK